MSRPIGADGLTPGQRYAARQRGELPPYVKPVGPKPSLALQPEYERRYRERHPERQREAARRWRESHPGWWRKYAGTDKRRAANRDHHVRNREHRRLAARARYKANPAPFIESARRHQIRVKGAAVERVDYNAIIERGGGICGICREPVAAHERSFDHIVPVSRGGAHSYANVQLAHFVCNCRKGAR